MANWQRTLDIKEEWDAADALPEAGLIKLAQAIADKLKALAPFGIEEIDRGRNEVEESFRDFVEENNPTFEAFNRLMDELYSWADTSLDGSFSGKKACWVKTVI